MAPDGRLLAVCQGGTLALLDVDGGKGLREFVAHESHVIRGAAYLPDRKHAMSAALDRTLRMWKLPK